MSATEEEALEQLVSELRYVRLALGQLKEQEADALARLRERYGDAPAGTLELYGKPVLKITRRKVFNEARAWDVLTEAEKRLVSEPIIQAVKAKALLSPARYAECQVESDKASFALVTE